MENEIEQDDAPASAEEQAAFAASFNADPGAVEEKPTPAPAPAAEPEQPAAAAEEQPQEQPAQAPAPAPAVEQPVQEAAPAPTPAPDAYITKEEARRLYGRMGELNELVKKLQAKEAEAKPVAAPAPVALSRTAEQFPELVETLGEDIALALAGVAQPKGLDPKELGDIVERQVQQRLTEQRLAEIAEAHPSWMTDVWAQAPTAELGGVHTPAFAAWKATLAPGVAERMATSASPAYVSARLSEFYEWKNKAAQAAADKATRLKDAVTPQGVARAAPPAISDEEAERIAFSEEFNKT